MVQLFGAVFAIILTLGLSTLSVRMMKFNEGCNTFYYSTWWWMTALSALAVMIAFITTGVVLQRSFF